MELQASAFGHNLTILARLLSQQRFAQELVQSSHIQPASKRISCVAKQPAVPLACHLTRRFRHSLDEVLDCCRHGDRCCN